MIPETEKLFNDGNLNQAANCYGIDISNLKKLGGFEAFVYEFQRDDKSFIMKITHSIRRTVDYIMGELEFVNYLAQNGIPTAKAIPSVNGELVETIDAEDGSFFLVYVFEKLMGRETDHKDWTDDFIVQWGQFSGRMNALSKEYYPSHDSYRRQVWNTDDIYNFEKYVPASEYKAIENCRKIISHVKSYPVDNNSFGLIHGDMHPDNFFINDGKIEIFDFDDCEYSHYVNDIAVPLYYAAPGVEDNYGNSREEYSEYFLSNFMKGYYKENHLERFWIEKIPEFLLVRTVIMFSLCHQIWPNDHNERQQAFFTRFKRRLNDGEPVIDIDFSKFV